MYTFSCLNHIFLSYYFFLHQINHCLTGNAFYHIQHIITNAICQWLMLQQPNKTTPPMISQCLHPAAPLLPPCCQPLPSLAAHCLPFAAQCWYWPLLLDTWSVIRLHSMRRPLYEQNKKGKHSLLQLVEYNSCYAKATTLRNGQRHGNSDGQWRWQLQWLTVMEMAMANSKGNSNSNG